MIKSMVKHIDPVGHELFKLTIDDAQYLGIHIASSANSRATKQFTEDSQTQGFIVRDEQVSGWEAKGLIEHDGEIYLYGPYLAGRSVDEILTNDPQNSLSNIRQLARAFAGLKEQQFPFPRFQTNSILFLDDGGLLFFPPPIMERMRNTQIESERIRTYELYNNQDLTNEDNLSFVLGVLTYRLMTGILPFPGNSEEEIHHKIRELKLVPPHLRDPDIREDVSAAIMGSLRKTKQAPLDLPEWVSALKNWETQGYKASIKEDERDSLLELGRKLEKRNATTFRSQQFFQRQGRLLIGLGIIVIIIGSVVGSIVRNALQPRATLGLGPQEVVELFYASITDLSHQSIEDCVADDVAKAEITEATNLYVISRMRLGQEGTTGMFPAQQWKDAGEPELREGYYVYGVSDLVITQLEGLVFRAVYEKLRPQKNKSLHRRHARR